MTATATATKDPNSPLRGMSDAQASVAVFLMNHCRSDAAAVAAPVSPTTTTTPTTTNYNSPSATAEGSGQGKAAASRDMQAMLMAVCKGA